MSSPTGMNAMPVVSDSISRARNVQASWRNTSIRDRLKIVRSLRWQLAERCEEIASTAASSTHPVQEVLVSELLPLLDASRFLERRACALLKPRRLGFRGRPWWLWGVDSTLCREPFGVVGVISPSNYPLFLGAVQTLQALVAGNAVIWKPAEGAGKTVKLFQSAFITAGLPADLLTVLPDTLEAGISLSGAEIDKLVFTGGFDNGTKVLGSLSRNAVPAIVELSGSDSVFVREDADLVLAAKALRFGLLFNQSRTCMAPRRVYASTKIIVGLEMAIKEALAGAQSQALEGCETAASHDIRECLLEALDEGAHLVHGSVSANRTVYPCVVSGVNPEARILQKDFLLPVLCLIPVDSDAEALSLSARNRHALGASVFSRDPKKAAAMAQQINAGLVSVNDLIVPSADPRIPFGGSGRSGFGVTRGAEGLLSLTRTKVLQIRKGGSLAHFESGAVDSSVCAWLLKLMHGGSWTGRFQALLSLVQWTAKNSGRGQKDR